MDATGRTIVLSEGVSSFGRTISQGPPSNLRKTDIIFELRAKDGGAKAYSGLIDQRLFKGTNKLHAIMDPQTCLWRLRLEDGITPQPMQQQFTNFSKCYDFVRNYFERRNIEIVKVID